MPKTSIAGCMVQEILMGKNIKFNDMICTTDNFVCHGYMTLTNTGGIEVELADNGDTLRYRFGDGETFSDPIEVDLETFFPEDDRYWPYDDDECRTGFQIGPDQIYYLDQFMRSGS